MRPETFRHLKFGSVLGGIPFKVTKTQVSFKWISFQTAYYSLVVSMEIAYQVLYVRYGHTLHSAKSNLAAEI